MAKILLIESSSEVCSTAVSVDGVVVAQVENIETQSHAALLTLQIRDCCAGAGIPLARLDAVAISSGPGSYTSLRVGSSVAKGICYALDKPLIAVDTLLALAYAGREGIRQPVSNIYLPVLDARRQEVWLAAYDSTLRQITPAQPLILDNNMFEVYVQDKMVLASSERAVLSGNGMEKIRNGVFLETITFSAIKKCSAGYLSILAEQFFQKGDFQDIAYFEPCYMKPPNITVSTKPLF